MLLNAIHACRYEILGQLYFPSIFFIIEIYLENSVCLNEIFMLLKLGEYILKIVINYIVLEPLLPLVLCVPFSIYLSIYKVIYDINVENYGFVKKK